MKVFYDARYTKVPQHDGVSRYGAELLRELVKIRSDVTMIISDGAQLANLPENVPYVVLSSPTSPKEPWIAHELNKQQPDVVFSPLQTMGSFGKKYKLILTIHDLIYYTYPTPPASVNAFVRLLWRLYHLSYAPERWLLGHADAVVTVSETSKQDILAHKLTTKPLFVVPNAATPSAGGLKEERDDATRPPTEKNLVYMGSFLGYKNVDTLVRGMRLLPEYKLYLMSKVSDAEKERLQNLAVDKESLVFENGASDERYHELLQRATALVSASKFEGFGIPVIEAMQEGVPVVCSDIPIFREVGGEAALYFEPDNEIAFAAQVTTLENPLTRQDTIEKSRTNASRYSWQKSASLLSEAIDSL